MRKLFRRILQILDGSPTAYGNRQRGQSTLELAFITPLLVMLIVGIVEVGWYANNYLALIEVTRVGARRGTILTGDNSPLAWNNAASVGRWKVMPGQENNEPDVPIVFFEDPGYVDATAENFRSACRTLIETDLGFYNLIVCQMLNSLDPLSMGLSIPGQVGEPALDDIVVSVFAIQTVNNDDPLNYDPETESSLYRRTYDFSLFNPLVLPENRLPEGFKVVVVGRYPTNANECTSAPDGVTGVEIERDPFDYIIDGNHPTWVGDLNFELAGHDGGLEYQRGFLWYGQHSIDDPRVLCWGSEFDIAEIEELMNLPGFELVGVDEFGDDFDNRDYLTPSMGMVLVEIFWEHDTMLHFPLLDVSVIEMLNPIIGSLGTRPMISVWAAFPAPAAEPNISFNLVE